MERTAQIDLDILPPDIRITFPYRTESVKGAICIYANTHVTPGRI